MTLLQILLERFAYSPMGTFGRLTLGNFSCFTLEEVWRNNLPSVPHVREGSCIPLGEYTIRRDDFPTHKDTFEVLNVPGRTAILIHPGNTTADIEGCIAPGRTLGALGGRWAVLNSGDAYHDFMRRMEGVDQALLKIVNASGMGVVV